MNPERDPFQGTWTVHESVFDGAVRRGVVIQTRRLVRDGDRLRVIQDNQPDAALAAHAMARFAGHHEFVIERDGCQRRYVGPAVIGTGLELGDGAMIGAGVWPALGWTFSSWAFLTAPDRQLTGGHFTVDDGRSIATIVGVATPGPEAPIELLGEVHAPAGWTGWRRVLDGRGQLVEQRSLHAWRPGREAGGVREQTSEADGRSAATLSVVDPATRTMWIVSRVHEDGVLSSIEVIRVQPEGASS
jgi:hypothetical protein